LDPQIQTLNKKGETEMNLQKLRIALLVLIVFVGSAVILSAQLETKKTETKAGPASRQAQVERGEVLAVDGNEVVVKMENGEVRHFTVPESARGIVDGKEIGVRDLKPGMKLQRTITVTTVPQTVTTIRTIKGKIFSVNPPNYIVLRGDDNSVKQYKVPKGQKFMIQGQEKTVFEVRPGNEVSATVITQVPSNLVSQEKQVTGSAPVVIPPQMEPTLLIEEPAPAPKAVAAAEPAPAPAAAEPAPKTLPKTGSLVPLMGLMGLVFSGLSLGIAWFRRSR